MNNFKLALTGERNMRWCTVILLNSCLLLATAACDSNKKPLHRDFGNSVNQNIHVHIIKPRVSQPDAAAPAMEGPRAHRAADRYHRGHTEKPEAESTTKSPGSGGK